MTITTLDGFVDGLGNNSSRILIDKATIANATAGVYFSLWRATGQPGQGAIPGAVAVCSNALTGAMNFRQQTAPATSYLAYAYATTVNSAMTVEIHDRLAHMGGLSGTVTTAQTVGLDLSTLLSTSNLDARKGDANYSDVQWWLEWYTDTGATIATATVNVTYNDGTTGNLTGVALTATRRAGSLTSLNAQIPAADAGKFIRGVNSVTLSASTGAAGSFGITATRMRATIPVAIANFTQILDWAQLGLPEIHNSSCLTVLVIASTTATGAVRGGGKITHG